LHDFWTCWLESLQMDLCVYVCSLGLNSNTVGHLPRKTMKNPCLDVYILRILIQYKQGHLLFLLSKAQPKNALINPLPPQKKLKQLPASPFFIQLFSNNFSPFLLQLYEFTICLIFKLYSTTGQTPALALYIQEIHR
jgi:nucleoside recognition membrane protein YjiH